MKLRKVQETIASETARLVCLPILIGQTKEKHTTLTHEDKLRYNISKSIPGFDEEDQKQIPDVDGICLCAVEAIQKVLGLL